MKNERTNGQITEKKQPETRVVDTSFSWAGRKELMRPGRMVDSHLKKKEKVEEVKKTMVGTRKKRNIEQTKVSLSTVQVHPHGSKSREPFDDFFPFPLPLPLPLLFEFSVSKEEQPALFHANFLNFLPEIFFPTSVRKNKIDESKTNILCPRTLVKIFSRHW